MEVVSMFDEWLNELIEQEQVDLRDLCLIYISVMLRMQIHFTVDEMNRIHEDAMRETSRRLRDGTAVLHADTGKPFRPWTAEDYKESQNIPNTAEELLRRIDEG